VFPESFKVVTNVINFLVIIRSPNLVLTELKTRNLEPLPQKLTLSARRLKKWNMIQAGVELKTPPVSSSNRPTIG
jgi:hypothetical protein